MNIERLPLASLREAPYNPRRLSKRAEESLRRSLKTFGLVDPLIFNRRTGHVVGGHQRLKILKESGITEAECVVLDLSPEEERSLNVALNNPDAQGVFDEDLLAAVLADIKRGGAANGNELLAATGLAESAIAKLIGRVESIGKNLDDVPEPPKEAVSRRGDIWECGAHRVMNGDSTEHQDVAELMNNEKAVLMQTDPPYGVAYDNAERPNPGVAKPRVAKPRVANDELIHGPEMQAFLERMLQAALPYMKEDAAFYFWHPMLTQGTYVAAAAAAGILIHRQIIWVKPAFLLGRGDYHWRHELCFYGWRKGNRPPFYGPRNQDTIWEVGYDKDRNEWNHATPKPVELWRRPFENHTRSGEIAYEPFGGSGSQLIAAEKMGRRCYLMEFVGAYCDVAIKRWQLVTGQRARNLTRPEAVIE